IKATVSQARPVAALNSAHYASDDVEVVEMETEARPRRWTGWAAAAVIAGLLCGLSFFLVNTENEYIKSTLNPFAEMFSRKEVLVTKVVENEKTEAPQPAPVAEAVVAKADSMPVDSTPVNTSEPVTTVPT